ncbi:3-oxoacyl-ACP synthase III family protein [Pseudomonas putida]|uniref:3-oxoacyl-ACP synthase III family protein n=1 Tax=Pseudomonas putida TaxID=303 RepID=UPI0021F8DCAB|nr:ketoacyl-ACP synthase III [Pseudomonas putida]
MKVGLTGVRIAALTAALPEQRLPLVDLAADFGALEVKRIIQSTGIETVRVAGSLRTGDLCAAAARHLLSCSDTRAADIDGIVVVTQTPDDLMPGVAVQLQQRLGLSSECVAFDINYGCSGYVYGLYQAAMLIRSGGCRRVLLCTGDVTTSLLDPADRQVRMVFGDAASATLLEAGEDHIDLLIRSEGSGRDHLYTPWMSRRHQGVSRQAGFLHMNGTAIMNFALNSVPPAINELVHHCGLALEDMSMLALHQANGFMLNYLRKLLGVERDKVPINVREVGNTGPSSIALLLASLPAGSWPEREHILLCGFGVGLSLGVARVDLRGTRIFEPVEVPQAAA